MADDSRCTFPLHFLMFFLVKQVNFPADTFLQFLGVVCITVHVKPTHTDIKEVLTVLTLHSEPNYINLGTDTSVTK